MSNKIMVGIVAVVPDTDGAHQMAFGKFVMDGDWLPVEAGHPDICDSHPTRILSVEVCGPRGVLRHEP